MTSLKLANVGKQYVNGANVVNAIEDLSLEVEDNEFVVLLGPSGCGKTTLLRMIAGLESVTNGSISFDDMIVNQMTPKDRNVAMVFQDFALYPHMTVAKNLSFALQARKVAKSEIESRITSVARTLGLSDLLNRLPQELSGGQQQRVALGRAMVREPAVYLFDEPLSNLDTQLRSQMRSEIKRLRANIQTTTIYVTHDQEEALALADKVVVMNSGKIHQYGSPWDVYHKPADRFVAGFIGMPTMNFLDGEIQTENDRPVFASKELKLTLPTCIARDLSAVTGKQISAGIRAFDLRISAKSHNENGLTQGCIPVKVELVEMLGESLDIHLRTIHDNELVARVSHRSEFAKAHSGDQLHVSFDAESVHVFDSGPIGMNLSLDG